MIKSYRDLDVWQESIAFTESVYAVSARFPADERFGLTSQLRRAAVSIASNIAEGHARGSTRDYMRFLSISLGSLAEAETQLHIAARLDFISAEQLQVLTNTSERIGRMLRGLTRALSSKLPSRTEPA